MGHTDVRLSRSSNRTVSVAGAACSIADCSEGIAFSLLVGGMVYIITMVIIRSPCRWPSALAYLLRAFGSHLAHERNSASRTTWPTRARPASVFGPVHLSRAAYAPVPRRLARLAGRPAVGTLSSGARACRSRQYEAASAAFTFSASGMGSSRMRRPERDGNGGRSRAHARVHAVREMRSQTSCAAMPPWHTNRF